MAYSSMRNIIQVDDDPSQNLLCSIVVRRVLPEANFRSFLIPEEALNYIVKEFDKMEINHLTTIFLDINMPSMSGWEFLEEFEKFPEHIQKQFTVHMLSSSVDVTDREKASSNRFVASYISKPLRQEMLRKLVA